MSNTEASVETHPVQTYDGKGGKCPKVVTMRAYEVYCHHFSPQASLVTDGCRGGMSAGEIIAFLYARSFPQEEWSARVREAFKGMERL